MTVKLKYTQEQENELNGAYKAATTAEERDDVVELYVNKFGKPKRSIIAKLSRMGIYISKVRTSKITGEKPETKEQLVTRIEKRFHVIEGTFIGLEKAPKLVLVHLLNDNPEVKNVI